MKIAIIRYNGGNARSVELALQRLSVDPVVTSDPSTIKGADRVVFPGVGNAGAVMKHLQETNLDILIRDLTQPVLGICLGMQLLGSYSEEGNVPCLGIIPTRVTKLSSTEKIPHVGWSQVSHAGHPLFSGIPPEEYFYFVHSYWMHADEYTAGTCFYGKNFTAALQWRNFFGTQFHPEKSGQAGERVLENFLEIPS